MLVRRCNTVRHRNIYSERVRVNKTTDEVASAIGVSKSTVLKWEAGTSEPSGTNLVKLANLFGCTPDYLLDMTDERTGQAAQAISG
jgi:transcriptional regulator with XRE-family HTH domain